MPDTLGDIVGEPTCIELLTRNYLMVTPLEPAATTILETSTGYPGEECSYKQVRHISRMAGLRLRDVNRDGDGSDESIR